jgi:hypothetical protein
MTKTNHTQPDKFSPSKNCTGQGYWQKNAEKVIYLLLNIKLEKRIDALNNVNVSDMYLFYILTKNSTKCSCYG